MFTFLLVVLQKLKSSFGFAPGNLQQVFGLFVVADYITIKSVEIRCLSHYRIGWKVPLKT